MTLTLCFRGLGIKGYLYSVLEPCSLPFTTTATGMLAHVLERNHTCTN